MANFFVGYTTSSTYDSDYRDFEDTNQAHSPLLRGRSVGSSADTISSGYRWGNCLMFVLFAMMFACLWTIPYGVAGLSDSGPYKTQGMEYNNVGPIAWFPSAIIRVNKVLSDTVYTSSPDVVLSKSDSMFFQWQLPGSELTSCHIGVTVPGPEESLVANQVYISSGALDEIEIWNVSSFEPEASLSWNTRPKRISLLGTVAFSPGEGISGQQKVEDDRQLYSPGPRFSCGENATYTIEVACGACKVEFTQVPSSPALAFNLIQFG